MTYFISPDIQNGSLSQKEHVCVTCSLLKYLPIATACKWSKFDNFYNLTT